ncbi:MAG: sulfatase-like hydrolase/transferase [Prevotella sp.]|nr:sulfatase-like hydrolase/transferase [Prevotella sp.]
MFLIFLLWTLVGVLSKLVFLAVYASIIDGICASDWWDVIWHGLILDVAIAGYLTIIPALIFIASLWIEFKAIGWIWKGYVAIVAFISSLAYVANIALYGFWGFPLDNTPLLYIKTSPSDAMASVTTWQLIGGLLAVCASMVFIYLLITRLVKLPKAQQNDKPLLQTIVILLLAALLIIPIRGGFGAGTNHTGAVYYSTNIRLCHAAVNPIFCFIESVTHDKNIADKYRFMDDKEATDIFSDMTYTALRKDSAGVFSLRGDSQPRNVVVIMLESFSKYIMTEAGHVKGITPNLDRYSKEGMYFTRFYANSFRTDRAIVSILSGLPAQPTMSVMDIPHKSTVLPSIASAMGRAGYNSTFYYGGDTNFSNMRSYLMGTGFKNVVSDKDFPKELHTGKWGVADGPVYERILKDMIASDKKEKHLRVVMSESSHEPFDVPFKSHIKEPELNAFYYADKCLGEFVEAMKKQADWDNTLVLIVPDHLGAYPLNIDNYAMWRYELPMILLGGKVAAQQIETIGCQTDIPATLLGILGIEHNEFLFSKDILDAKAPHFAFFTFPDAMGMVTEENTLIYDNALNKPTLDEGSKKGSNLNKAKAYLQKLYDSLAE